MKYIQRERNQKNTREKNHTQQCEFLSANKTTHSHMCVRVSERASACMQYILHICSVEFTMESHEGQRERELTRLKAPIK